MVRGKGDNIRNGYSTENVFSLQEPEVLFLKTSEAVCSGLRRTHPPLAYLTSWHGLFRQRCAEHPVASHEASRYFAVQTSAEQNRAEYKP